MSNIPLPPTGGESPEFLATVTPIHVTASKPVSLVDVGIGPEDMPEPEITLSDLAEDDADDDAIQSGVPNIPAEVKDTLKQKIKKSRKELLILADDISHERRPQELGEFMNRFCVLLDRNLDILDEVVK